MYLKVSTTRNGKKFLSIIQGYRDQNGKVRQKTIEKIGWLDDLEEKYDNPIEHFKDVVKKRNSNISKELLIRNIDTKLIDINSKKQNLGYVILKRVYNELGIDKYLKDKQKEGKMEFDLNQIFSLLVFSRILYPTSKKSTYENKTIYFDKFDFSIKDMYRALDYFYKYKENLEILLWKNTKKQYERDTSKTYYDCTNYYFEIECNDDDKFDENNNLIKKGYRKRGPEKNHRPDPIIEMGLLMDSSGIPIAYNLFPGNESEKLTLAPEIAKLKDKFKFKRTIVVADRGLNCSDNIIRISGTSLEMSKNMNGYIYGQSVRGADEEFKNWVLSGDYKVDTINNEDDEKIKFVHKSRIYPKKMYIARDDLGTTKNGNKKKQSIMIDQKQMVYYSEKYAKKQKHDREMMINKAKDLVKYPNKYNKATSYGAANYVKNLIFSSSTGEIISSNNLSIDEEKIKNEEKFDGYYSIVTSEENLPDLEIRNIYRGLSKIEDTFKVTKSLLNARPVFVWTNEHIEAHFLTCFISLYITRLLENKLSYKYSAQKIINSLRNYTSTNIEYDIYLQDYYDGIINDLNSIYNLNLDRKYLSLSEIKKILKI